MRKTENRFNLMYRQRLKPCWLRCPLLISLVCCYLGYGEIDQVSRSNLSQNDSSQFIQTFTPGKSEPLVGVWLYMKGSYTDTSNDVWTVQIHHLDGTSLGTLLTQGQFTEHELNTNEG
mgnify:CR=1 FL=1